MKCQFCLQQDPKNNFDHKNMDNPVEHLIITMDTRQHFHIHGPIDNGYMMQQMTKFLLIEMSKNGIDFKIENYPLKNNNSD